MSLRDKYRKILQGIVPAGAVGASLLLGSVVAGRAEEEPEGVQPRNWEPAAVADRLVAVREAVTDVANGQSAKSADPELRLAWGNWWRNWGWGGRPWGWGGWGGWGWPNWNNWHNWNNWRNWWRNW